MFSINWLRSGGVEHRNKQGPRSKFVQRQQLRLFNGAEILVHPRMRKRTFPGWCSDYLLRQSPLPLLLEGPVPRTAVRPKRVLLLVDPVSQLDPRDRDRRVGE